MKERILVRKGTYHDSAFLMRASRTLSELPGMTEAVLMMGTPMNKKLMADAGFDSPQMEAATAMDLMVAMRAEDEKGIEAAGALLDDLLVRGRARGEDTGAGSVRPTFQEALDAHEEANLVSVAVPGVYAAYVAHKALDAGRHVFLFSDNVSLADEIALKQRAHELGLLVMGPDCGTAILAGVGLGFANRVSKGPVGVVGASGTGIQEITSILAASGVGISQAIGTGSRDLSSQVGGLMTKKGLDLLADDPDTRVCVLVAKHPDAEVAERLHTLLAGLGKPCVVRYLGQPERKSADGVLYAETLDHAAMAAASLATGKPVESNDLQKEMKAVAGRIQDGAAVRGRLLGLFGGGSLASEASLILSRKGLRATTPSSPLQPGRPLDQDGPHLVVDTGDDFYTVGRPHPMVDQKARCDLIASLGRDPSVGLVLFDLVLGDGAHPDPAPELAEAVARARSGRADKGPVVIASITGTPADPQDMGRQRQILENAGVHTEPTAARAALLAACLLAG